MFKPHIDHMPRHICAGSRAANAHGVADGGATLRHLLRFGSLQNPVSCYARIHLSSIYTHMHTKHIRTCLHADMYARHAHVHVCTCMHLYRLMHACHICCIHTCTHARMHDDCTHICTQKHSTHTHNALAHRLYTCVHMCGHASVRAQHRCMHTCMRACIHVYMHTFMHAYMYVLPPYSCIHDLPFWSSGLARFSKLSTATCVQPYLPIACPATCPAACPGTGQCHMYSRMSQPHVQPHVHGTCPAACPPHFQPDGLRRLGRGGHRGQHRPSLGTATKTPRPACKHSHRLGANTDAHMHTNTLRCTRICVAVHSHT